MLEVPKTGYTRHKQRPWLCPHFFFFPFKIDISTRIFSSDSITSVTGTDFHHAPTEFFLDPVLITIDSRLTCLIVSWGLIFFLSRKKHNKQNKETPSSIAVCTFTWCWSMYYYHDDIVSTNFLNKTMLRKKNPRWKFYCSVFKLTWNLFFIS